MNIGSPKKPHRILVIYKALKGLYYKFCLFKKISTDFRFQIDQVTFQQQLLYEMQ